MRNFHFPGRSTVHATNAMVATSHPQASLAAIEVLREGGTAVDAAVAGSALLGVIEPQSTGIGGDCFALIQPRGEGNIIAYNGSGRAPKAANADWYLERKINSVPLTSAHAVSIPGVIDAFATVLRDHGKFGFDRLLQPAIKAAEEGYVVAPRIAFDWKNQFEKLKGGTNTVRYLLPGGKPPVAGDVIRQAELGKTLRAIAKDGRDAFYKGAIAEDMVETLRGIGGLHTLDDFAAHTTETTTPIGTNYKGYDVWQCPPNGPGVTALLMLNILSRFDLTKYAPLSIERFHLEAEAARIAYMNREMHVADPEHMKIDVAEMLAKGFADEYISKIRMDGMLDLPNVAPPMNPSTIYITVVDKDRNVCSFINSIAHSFGSAIVSNKTGVLFQNRAGGFPHPARPSQLHRRGQAPAAHDHAEPPQQGRPLRDAVRGDGRTVPAGRPDPRGDQHPRLWLRRAGGDRHAARSALRGPVPARGQRACRYRRGPQEARPQDHQRGRPARRRPGDLDRLGQGHAHRRFRSAQGRLRAGLLSGARGLETIASLR
ncbi:gamma-glutamyltranspeptidase/glutathione hydrolase [Bradyrhizobium japonicum]